MKFKLYSLLAAVAVATTMFFASCSEDKCKNVTCQNAGTCVDGACKCALGYEGTNCETESRVKFTGTTSTSYTFDDSFNGTTAAGDYNVSFSKDPSDVKKMILTNFGGYGTTAVVTVTVSGSTFTQSGTYTTGGVTLSEIQGSKNSAGKITFSYKVTDTAGSTTFTATQI